MSESHVAPVAETLAHGILLASHGTMDSDAAARVARAFATRHGVPMAVLGVLSPTPSQPQAMQPGRAKWIIECVEEQLERASAEGVPIDVRTGDVTTLLVDEAMARHASVIALGLTSHTTVERLIGAELAIRVLHRCDVPVLAVAYDAKGLMDTIVIAFDFSPAAARVAELALAFASDGAAVHVVHVSPLVDYLPGSAPRRQRYERAAYELLEQFTNTLPLPPRAQVKRHVLYGEPAEAIRRLAEQEYADLIALGTYRPGLADRVIVGSVAESLLRHAGCSVLVVPLVHAEEKPQ
ncbi:MAG TPA: universal stress protein [Gemmatimonadaceae bacterium]|nr:universal stress protein [Gemmatimonadaceae bacterium]